jgi:hypothetical protein
MNTQGLFTEVGEVEALAMPVEALHRNPDRATSVEGAHNVQMRSGTQKVKLLAAYAIYFELTDDEAAAYADLLQSTYWRRCGELRDLGLIEDTGKTRPGRAGVSRMICRITNAGHEALAKIRANNGSRS